MCLDAPDLQIMHIPLFTVWQLQLQLVCKGCQSDNVILSTWHANMHTTNTCTYNRRAFVVIEAPLPSIALSPSHITQPPLAP